jgi:hypothetical protein
MENVQQLSALGTAVRLLASMASSSVNMFRQLGSVLGPSVLGTIVITRVPNYLQERLTAPGIPGPQAAHIAAAAMRGASPASLPPALAHTVADSAADAFTDAIHLGLIVGAITLLVMAIPAALYVRHRNGPTEH